MNVTFLLGAGASHASGYPLATGMTSYIQTADFHEYAGSYVPGRGQHTDKIRTIQELFDILRGICNDEIDQISATPRIPREANYEDVSDFAQRLNRYVNGEFESPPIGMYAERLDDTVDRLCNRHEQLHTNEIYSEVCKLIEDAVIARLGAIHVRRGYDVLTSAIESSEVKRLTIATLNHDLILEGLLNETLPFEGRRVPKWSSRSYTDGFNSAGCEDGDVRWYARKALLKGLEDNPHNRQEVTLLKLHGSIHWWTIRQERDSRMYDDYCVIETDDNLHPKDAAGKMLPIPHGPSILTGRGKEIIYQAGIFAHMWDAFLSRLELTNVIVATGFSWSDLGVVQRIKSWLNDDSTRRLIVYDEDDTSVTVALGALDHEDQIICTGKYMCDDAEEFNEIVRQYVP